MSPYFCESTPTTPRVLLDASTGKLEISGRSLPENTSQFYEPVLYWLQRYLKAPQITTCLEVNLEYYNSGSNMVIFKIMRMLEGLPGLVVIWAYHPDDEEMLEAGRELSRDTHVTFAFREHVE